MGATTLLRTAIWVLLATFAAAAIAPSILDTHTATLLCIYALLALSLGFIWGFGGILCFGQAAFFGLGGYAYALAALNFNGPWAAFFIAILVPLVFAAALGAILFYGRLTDVYRPSLPLSSL
jgi:branched-chain amino acid transport system permease protein